MNVETLKFLLTASQYLRISGRELAVPRDLQAVERVLPDCDWFEMGESGAAARKSSNALWADGFQIDF